MTTTTEATGVVVLAFGAQPVTWLSQAAKACGDDAAFCPDTARMAGCNIALGSPAALAALRERLEAGAIAAQSKLSPDLGPAVTRWLAVGERGMSSNAIFTHLTGIPATTGNQEVHYPIDHFDFRRCRLLLEQVPGLSVLFHLMSGASPQWANLVAGWQEICQAMDEEWPNWRSRSGSGSASKTCALIKKAITLPPL